MQQDLTFRLIVMALFVGVRCMRWRARGQIGWQASWPSMKKHPLDTTLLILLSLCWLAAVVLYLAFPWLVERFHVPLPAWLRWCAVVAAVGGLALLWWSDRCLEPYCVTCAHRARIYAERPTGAGQWMAFSLFGWRPCRLGGESQRDPQDPRAPYTCYTRPVQ